MNALFCGSNGEFSVKALELLAGKGIDVQYVLLSDAKACDKYEKLCRKINAKIIYTTSEEDFSENQFDMLVSFTYQRKLKAYTINSGKFAINFHPAPLPEYRGRGTNMFAIINGEKKWAVTCHYLDARIDTGKIIERREFNIEEAGIKTGKQLADYGWMICLEILDELIDKIKNHEYIEGRVQSGVSTYYSMKDLQNAKQVELSDGAEIINRKINALWFPPYEGVYVKIEGKKFYLVNEEIMADVMEKLGSLE